MDLLVNTSQKVNDIKIEYLKLEPDDIEAINALSEQIVAIHDEFAQLSDHFYSIFEIAEEKGTSEQNLCEKVIDSITEFREILDALIMKLKSHHFYELEYFTKLRPYLDLQHKMITDSDKDFSTELKQIEESKKSLLITRTCSINIKRHKVKEIFVKAVFSIKVFSGLFNAKKDKILALYNISADSVGGPSYF